MHSLNRIGQFVAAFAVVAGLSATAHAQIGTGWTSTSVSFVVQTSTGCTVSGNTFKVPSGTSGRAERRYATNTFSQRQFQGDVVVNSLGGDRVNIKQTFNEAVGPYNIIAVTKSPASLYEVEGGNTLFTGTVVNSSIRINTIIFTSGNVTVYVNGTFKETKTGAAAGTDLYDKVGAYISGSGSGPCTTTWTGVQFWKK